MAPSDLPRPSGARGVPVSADGGPPLYDLRLITIKGTHDGDLPTYSEFAETQWQYLVGRLDPHPSAWVTVCVWELWSTRWLLPPEYLAEYRRRVTDGGRSLLAVSYRYSPELDWRFLDEQMFDEGRSASQRRMDFAWRLERHWMVEWADGKDPGMRRPPIAMLSEDAEPVLVGGDLSPRLRSASAALTAFQLVTADELRAASRSLGEPEPSASDLSRVLTYFEEAGWLIEAPDQLATRYWRERDAVGRRPLRLFLSVLANANSWTGESRVLGLRRPRANFAATDRICRLTSNGLPTPGSERRLALWKIEATELRDRGLRTV